MKNAKQLRCDRIVIEFAVRLLFSLLVSHSDWNITYGEELYDHSIDPDEMMNLATRSPFIELTLQLNKLLREKLRGSSVARSSLE